VPNDVDLICRALFLVRLKGLRIVTVLQWWW